MSKPSPSQNSSVETICAPGIVRASVVFPAAPCPPMPTRTRPPPLRSRQRDQLEHAAVRPPSHGTLSAWRSFGSAAWRSRTASSCTGRPRGARRSAPPTARSAPLPARSGVSPPGVTTPFVRGPLRLAEAFAVLPDVRRALPEARFPVRAPARRGRGRRRRPPRPASHAARASGFAAREAVAALASLAPAAIALRAASSPPTTAPSTSRSGPTRPAEPATKEHDRCGGHLVGPLLLTTRRPARLRRGLPLGPARPRVRSERSARSALRSRSSPGWGATREHPVSRALARPGHELQARVSTAEPSAAQLEVAEAALAACLAAEEAA